MRITYLSICSLLVCVSAEAQPGPLNTVPSRVVGHPNPEGLTVSTFNPNLIEGRELYDPLGLAVDTSASPPILYVADTANNRVMAWKNATGFTSGQAADLVIGQPDVYTTLPGGPGTTFSAGMNSPTGLAVLNGDLYVVDSGNNRVLRFPKPFSNSGQPQVPNLIIGQPDLNSRLANYPNGQPSANGIFTYSGSGSPYFAGIAFDSSGNLWLTDPGNRRVLSYPAAAISANPAIFPAASFVLGSDTTSDFTDVLPALSTSTSCTGTNSSCAYSTSQFYIPSAVAFDAKNRLYVADADPSFVVNRVLVFTNLNTTPTGRIIGLPPQGTSNPSASLLNQTLFVDPSGIFFIPDPQAGQDVGVVDTGSSRILIFPSYEQWTDPLVALPATQVIGQGGDFTNRNRNHAPFGATYAPPPTGSTLAYPASAVFANNQLYVADSYNNRVVLLAFQSGVFNPAVQIAGQLFPTKGSINYIEGREFQFPWEGGTDAGIAIDSTGPTQHLYVADPGNNRVLGFKDLNTVAAGSMADIVIGQPDFYTAVCNYQASSPTTGGDPTAPNQSSLCAPIGLAVDSQGNLYVADSFNGRVLRFPAPFSYQGSLEPADLVLGQQDFTSQFTDPSPYNLNRPYGLAFSGTNGLLVSDAVQNRVLYFPMTSGAFTSANSGMAATKVFGQNQFNSVTPGNGAAQLNAPHHISADTSGRVYVADTGNNRVQIFADPNQPTTSATGASAVLTVTGNFNSPQGIYVSPVTGQFWVADTNNGQAKQFERFDQVQENSTVVATVPAAAAALAVAQDQYGNLLMADNSNRVALYFPAVQTLNAANLLVTTPHQQLAPGVIASICAANSNVLGGQALPEGCETGATVFPNVTTAQASGYPLPATLGGVQVLFNGSPTPLIYVSPTQINFVVPMGQSPGQVPTTGNAALEVVVAATGQVLAAGSIPMSVASPGIFQLSYTGTTRQAAVLNSDNTLNSSTNPAARGSVIQIFATGEGFVPGAPPDGSPAKSPTPAPGVTSVIIGACDVDDSACTMESFEHIQYSGLTAFPGGWQINVQIPQNTPPGIEDLFVGMNGFYSSDPSAGYTMVIYVK
jgi:uncharacterized protein (TIGR03437 family)